MSLQFHKRVRQLFDEALERPEGERLLYLERACGDDASLFDAVERLLVARSSASTFLATAPQDAKRIGRYVIREELGRGAMGVVYDALDPLIGRSVAVKVIHLQAFTEPHEAEFLTERLFREARSAGQLFHPGIVIILDVGKEGDTAFIAMEKVEGQSLQQILASGRRLSVGEALGILHQTAAALDYAHEHSVVHRDIKPANIMLHQGTLVKVADFGIAKVMSAHQSTMAGVVMGTPSYMSPEQVQAQPVDGRSDQFSLAVLAYELLTGTRPFQGDSLATLSYMIVHGERPSAKAANPALLAGGDNVLRRGLGKLPEERYPSCEQFVAALEAALTNLPMPAIEEPTIEKQAVKKRNPAVYVIGAAVVMAALVLGFLFYRDSRSRPEPVAKEIAPSPKKEITPPPKEVPVNPPSGSSSPASAQPVEVKSLEEKSKPAPQVSPAARIQQLYEAGVAKHNLALLRQAAELGEDRAMVLVGESYRDGEGVKVDENEALRWFRLAAQAGNSSGMVDLGAMYISGDGVEESFPEAVKWFQKAADRGNPHGLFNLGQMYERGEGVGYSLTKAKELYRKAADLGNAEAQKRLTQLGK